MNSTTGIFTGIKEWDEINGRPLFPGLFIVASSSGIGRVAHMVECVCSMAKNNEIGVISADMTNEQFLTRIRSNIGTDNGSNLKLQIKNIRDINDIEDQIKIWVGKSRVKCVVADFLNLFEVPIGFGDYTSAQEIQYLLAVFSRLSKSLEIPIIIYVQASREISGGEPDLSNLLPYASIEELAYQVSFLQDDSQIILKHKNGKLGRIKIK